jgi:hypothetical protein
MIEPRARRAFLAVLVVCVMQGAMAWASDVVLNAQGEFLDAYLIEDGVAPPRRVVFIDPDPPRPDDPTSPPPRVGRHVNGKVCFFPKGFGPKGGFVIADDTHREACVDRRSGPQARCSITNSRDRSYVGADLDGWGVFRRDGRWAKWVIQVDRDPVVPEPQGSIDPQGCLFDAKGNLWGNDVGNGGFGQNNGSLIVFFPGAKKRYDSYCFLDKTLASPGMPAMDDAGNIYVPEPAGGRITRFSPPFPASAADCANPERLVTTPPTKAAFATGSGLATPAGIVRVPGSTNFLVGSVVIPRVINEYDAGGAFVRTVVPDGLPRNPLGIGVGSDGTVYYSELNLDPATFRTRCGSVSRARRAPGGQQLPPEEIGRRLRFPDGVTVVDSRQLRVKWDKLSPSPDVSASSCGGEGSPSGAFVD